MSADQKRFRSIPLLSLVGAGALAVVLAAAQPALAGGDEKDAAGLIEASLAAGHVDHAIHEGERALAKAPRDGALRAELGRAYLKAGRFESAAAMLGDAAQLGQSGMRLSLNLALAQIATGQPAAAQATLEGVRADLPVSDYGLALALAGESDRAVAVLQDALRGGDTSARLRQNLSYVYALNGRWADARATMRMDLGEDQVDARLTKWAMQSRPGAYRERVAGLLGVAVRADKGYPAHLALAAAPAPALAAAETHAPARAASAAPAAELPAPAAELPAPAAEQPVRELPAVAPRMAADDTPPAAHAAPIHAAALRSPTFTQVFAHGVGGEARPAKAPAAHTPARVAQPARKPVPAEPVLARAGSHGVQLGAFSSQKNALAAKHYFQTHDMALRGHALSITPAKVGGRDYWRVVAEGYGSAQAANATCGAVKRGGTACFAFALATAPQGGALAMATPRGR